MQQIYRKTPMLKSDILDNSQKTVPEVSIVIEVSLPIENCCKDASIY